MSAPLPFSGNTDLDPAIVLASPRAARWVLPAAFQPTELRVYGSVAGSVAGTTPVLTIEVTWTPLGDSEAAILPNQADETAAAMVWSDTDGGRTALVATPGGQGGTLAIEARAVGVGASFGDVSCRVFHNSLSGELGPANWEAL